MKKFLCLYVSVFMLICVVSCPFVKAEEYNKIETLSLNQEIIQYAKESIKYHFFSISQDLNAFGFENEDLTNYKLGDGFSVYNIVDSSVTYKFVLLSNNDIVGLLEVYNDGDELHASLSKSYADEIDVMLNGFGNTYKIVTDNYNVYSVSNEDEVKIIDEIINNNNTTLDVPYEDIYVNSVTNYLTLSSISNDATTLYNPLTRGNVNQPNSYKTLSVTGVRQGTNQCWAATAAMNINYLKNTSLTANAVASRIYPSNPNQAAYPSTTIYAYSLWGVTGTSKSVLSFSTIKTNINNSKPIHLILNNSYNAHAASLIGYEDWDDRDILILIDPDGATRVTVELNSSGNFSYDGYYWIETIVLS